MSCRLGDLVLRIEMLEKAEKFAVPAFFMLICAEMGCLRKR